MEKYEKAQMEVIEFENEDVITASNTCNGVNAGIGGLPYPIFLALQRALT